MNEQDHLLIEKHHLGRLSPAEQQLFDEKMQGSEFQKEVDLQAAFMEVVEQRANLELKKTLKGEERRIRAAQSEESSHARIITNRFSRQNQFLLAAAVVLLAIVSFWLLQPKGNSPEAIFAEYHKPYPNEIVAIERGASETPTPEQKAFIAYQKGNYEAAIAQFDVLFEQDGDDRLLFYKANALLASGKTDEAIALFKASLKLSDASYHAPAKWYLALAYFKKGKKGKAMAFLKELQVEGNYKKKTIEKIIVNY